MIVFFDIFVFEFFFLFILGVSVEIVFSVVVRDGFVFVRCLKELGVFMM